MKPATRSAIVKGGARARAMAACSLVFAFAPAPARADDVGDFYRTHPLAIVVGHEAGTGYDLYARVVARHLARHLPGATSIEVRNMQGASGLVAGNWLYNLAPRDGSILATFAHTVIFEPLLGDGTARFEARGFTWIGNLEEGAPVCGVSAASGVTGFSDLLTREVVFGASGVGAGGPLVQSPNAVRALTGARIKVVQGYRGSYDIKLAIDRGEVAGICGLSFSTIRTEWRDMLDSGRFRVILQLGRKSHPDLTGVPTIYDFARSDEDRNVFDLVFGVQALGRLYVAPPGAPPARVQALREALMATTRDAAFLADADKAGLDLSVSEGDAVAALVDQFYAASPAAVARARRAVRGEAGPAQ